MKECCKSCIKNEISCPIEDCRHWMEYEPDLNCALIAVDNHGSMTLREVSDRLGVSFVRIKQIEDKALKKISSLDIISLAAIGKN